MLSRGLHALERLAALGARYWLLRLVRCRGPSSLASLEAWSLAGGSAVWACFPRRLLCGFGAGATFEAGRVFVLVTGPVFSLPSPTVQNAQPLHAFPVTAVPAADGLLLAAVCEAVKLRALLLDQFGGVGLPLVRRYFRLTLRVASPPKLLRTVMLCGFVGQEKSAR